MAVMSFRVEENDEVVDIYATEDDQVEFLIHGEAILMTPLEARQLVRVIKAAIEAAVSPL
jgi:hypothetical protein